MKIEFSELGIIFKEYVRNHLEMLSQNPLAFPKVSKNIRKFTLSKFPFKIYYSILENRIIIVSIRHQSRKPTNWDN